VLDLHRAERADGLVDALRGLLVDPLPDPFAPDVIAVPTRGMERLLTQSLSAALGARAGDLAAARGRRGVPRRAMAAHAVRSPGPRPRRPDPVGAPAEHHRHHPHDGELAPRDELSAWCL